MITNRIFKPVSTTLAVIGAHLTSIVALTRIVPLAGKCNGSCGACGLLCLSPVAVVGAGMLLLAIKKLKENWRNCRIQLTNWFSKKR